MKAMFLPDTNILIRSFLNIEPMASLFSKWLEREEVVLSAVCVSEFLVGASKEDSWKFEPFLDQLDVLPVDLVVARVAAEYRKMFLRKRKRRLLLDCFLAATAKVHNLILVTHNTTDFPMDDIEIFDPLK